MVAFSDLPKLTCVRMIAVSIVHSGRGRLSRCESMKLNTAAVVTRTERLTWALCSRTWVRSHLHCVAIRLMTVPVQKVDAQKTANDLHNNTYPRAECCG